LCLCLCLFADVASGYSIHSGLTDGCHERITRGALQLALPQLTPNNSIVIPKSKVWRKLADAILNDDDLKENVPQLTEDRFKLVFVSMLIGVRSPDTEGHAVTNFSSLRQIHADPSAEGQYAHALRGPDDDGAQGDEAAINGTRQAIIDLVQQAGESLRNQSPQDQIITVQLYFDFYGLVDIEVWEPAYLIGRSLHALQDSFAHTIRSNDLKRIRHVLNYVDAIAGDLKESVDGLPHSGHMDQCDGDTQVIADTAMLASADLIESINSSIMSQDVALIRDTLDEWITYEPGCTSVNDYCESIWVDLARQEPTGPYLEEFIGCDAHLRDDRMVEWSMLLMLCMLWVLRRSRLSVICFAMMMSGLIHDVQARSLVQGEVHASLLSDSPDRSVLANTYGWGLRGGYAWESWVALVHIEQNLWLSTELTDRTTRGVLNAGIGGAYLYGDEFIRSSVVIGTSTMLFDTIFDESGTTGLFFDLRPIELRWFPRDWLALNLTPFSFTYVSPALAEPAIRMVLYRTVFGAEFIF
jgi:hypothetical protein